ncbi:MULTISPECIES: HNH endonuclease [unclassified Fusibacter]|uniref:HNH endonuclease n=1 Tax=unclassified Fusibacter TaxID=2624464 RepID=UPI0010116F4A|nr:MULTISPECIES: HNH endonuclease [unclassified Fusibacter]MCK8060898.1 HNH endonuclease [Fusibacter sp. A2]NPE23194.1 hypothetical protein [Fusibacter sp. A1]RXV59552.1 hypothetical protein DWB64_15290 [Fusibacter sp. A1]
MKPNYIDKKYIYLREDQRCYYCEKQLKLGQVTLDHYEPKSEGGTCDYFNLVSSCKRCNTFKQSRVPADIESVHLQLFRQAVKDSKIISVVSKLSQTDFKACADQVTGVCCKNGEGLAFGVDITMHIKENKVYRIEGKCPLST